MTQALSPALHPTSVVLAHKASHSETCVAGPTPLPPSPPRSSWPPCPPLPPELPSWMPAWALPPQPSQRPVPISSIVAEDLAKPVIIACLRRRLNTGSPDPTTSHNRGPVQAAYHVLARPPPSASSDRCSPDCAMAAEADSGPFGWFDATTTLGRTTRWPIGQNCWLRCQEGRTVALGMGIGPS